jgi:hypothetical protein
MGKDDYLRKVLKEPFLGLVIGSVSGAAASHVLDRWVPACDGFSLGQCYVISGVLFFGVAFVICSCLSVPFAVLWEVRDRIKAWLRHRHQHTGQTGIRQYQWL